MAGILVFTPPWLKKEEIPSVSVSVTSTAHKLHSSEIILSRGKSHYPAPLDLMSNVDGPVLGQGGPGWFLIADNHSGCQTSNQGPVLYV